MFKKYDKANGLLSQAARIEGVEESYGIRHF